MSVSMDSVSIVRYELNPFILSQFSIGRVRNPANVSAETAPLSTIYPDYELTEAQANRKYYKEIKARALRASGECPDATYRRIGAAL